MGLDYSYLPCEVASCVMILKSWFTQVTKQLRYLTQRYATTHLFVLRRRDADDVPSPGLNIGIMTLSREHLKTSVSFDSSLIGPREPPVSSYGLHARRPLPLGAPIQDSFKWLLTAVTDNNGHYCRLLAWRRHIIQFYSLQMEMPATKLGIKVSLIIWTLDTSTPWQIHLFCNKSQLKGRLLFLQS